MAVRRSDWWRKADHAARSHALLLLLLAITLTKGILWSAVIPLGQAPDEPSHFSLIQFIAEFGRLPRLGEEYSSDELALTWRYNQAGWLIFHPTHQQTFAEEGMLGPNEPAIWSIDPALRRSFERHAPSTAQFVPPLYHALAALGYRLVYHQDSLTRLFAARLVSVLLTMLLVVVAYGLGRELFPADPAMQATVLTVVSFQPMVTFLGAVANSDILAFLLFGLISWMVVRALQSGLTWRQAAVLGIAFGLGILTKPMVLASGLGVAVLFVTEWVRRPKQRLVLLGFALLIIGLMLAVGGWYIVRNQRLHGTFLYSPPIASDPEFQAARGLQPRPDLTLAQYWRETFYPELQRGTFNSYWGNFGWLETPMADQVYLALRWICRLSCVGLLLKGLLALRQKPFPWLRVLILGTLALLAVSLLPPLLTRAYALAREIGWTHASQQGRYHLAAWLPQAVLLVTGLIGLFPGRLRPLGHFLVRAGIVVLNIYALFAVIVPRYYVP